MPDFSPTSAAGLVTDDPCRNYVCCGVVLLDLDTLVKHLELHHVELWVPDDSLSPPGTPALDADDMAISEPGLSPPATPVQSAFDSVLVDVACFRSLHMYTSSYSSLAGANGPQAVVNCYADHADYSSTLPGIEPSPTYDGRDAKPAPEQPQATVLPAMLHSSSAWSSPLTMPASSRTRTPAPVLPLQPPKRTGASAAAPKPFRCPKPGCTKSYKQRDGLTYHLNHGQCNSDRRHRFMCAVGAAEDCGRRYVNMSGLRYHYNNTGEHGALGLELLAQGHHPLPAASVSSTPAATPASRRATSPSLQRSGPSHPRARGARPEPAQPLPHARRVC